MSAEHSVQFQGQTSFSVVAKLAESLDLPTHGRKSLRLSLRQDGCRAHAGTSVCE